MKQLILIAIFTTSLIACNVQGKESDKKKEMPSTSVQIEDHIKKQLTDPSVYLPVSFSKPDTFTFALRDLEIFQQNKSTLDHYSKMKTIFLHDPKNYKEYSDKYNNLQDSIIKVAEAKVATGYFTGWQVIHNYKLKSSTGMPEMKTDTFYFDKSMKLFLRDTLSIGL